MSRYLCLSLLATFVTAFVACGTEASNPETPDGGVDPNSGRDAAAGPDAATGSDAAPDAGPSFATLTVSKTGTGAGAVASTPSGIDCGSDCSENFVAGTSVSLNATAATGSTFAGWSGGGCSGTGSCVTTVGADTTVTATFTLDKHTLTVSSAGNGGGSIESTPAGIDCGGDCTETYDYGTQVTLTANPTTGSTFTGWSGGGCGGTGACTTTITGATDVTATFTLDKHTLTVSRDGAGTGKVESTPAGIDCGGDCSEVYDYGSQVTLTAAPAAGSTFGGWSGGGCSGTGNCVTTITDITNVTASFALEKHTLTVTANGPGKVTSSPSGIDCGDDCTEDIDHGTVVTLTAAPTAGGTFTGWSGADCSGTGTCTVTMTTARMVTATFACSGSKVFEYTGTIETFALPACIASIHIDARGAQGGGGGALGGVGGLGARVQGTFAIAGGSTLKVLVGGQGLAGTDNGQQAGGSGGGGTFVVTDENQPLAIAGGGGGAMGRQTLVVNGGPGQAGTAGAAGQTNGGAGGTNGGGGATWPWAGWHSGTGGGGFSGDGVNDSNGNVTYGTINTRGKSFINGGAGGTGGSLGRNGGFGGGGAAGFTGGGGGGYSGGGSGTHDSPANPNGGGGGSYNAGTNPVNTAGVNSGNGTVTITW